MYVVIDVLSSCSYFEKVEVVFVKSLEIYLEFEYVLYNFGVFYMEIGVLD